MIAARPGGSVERRGADDWLSALTGLHTALIDCCSLRAGDIAVELLNLASSQRVLDVSTIWGTT